jgi:phage baseplate assembly protein V
MAAQGFVGSAIGIVTSYDPVHYAVKVHLQPPPAEGDATETGWLPVWSPWVGDKWGLFCPPVIGAQVIILFVAGDGQVGICLGALYSDADQPLNVPAGQFWVQDSAGAFLKFTNDGKVLLTAPQGFEVTGDTTITGKLHVTGAATLDSTLAVTGKTTAAEIDSSGPIKVGGVTVTVP